MALIRLIGLKFDKKPDKKVDNSQGTKELIQKDIKKEEDKKVDSLENKEVEDAQVISETKK